MRSHGRRTSLGTAVICGLCLATICEAQGANTSANVRFTWDRAGASTDVPAIPPAAPTPLYLQLDGANDIHAMAVRFAWIPAECYQIIPVTADTACGWLTPIPPGDFYGDSGYTSTIVFPPGSPKTCVVGFVSTACAFPDSANFCADVVTIDSRGFGDVFHVSGATIHGGILPCGCPLCLPSDAAGSPVGATIGATKGLSVMHSPLGGPGSARSSELNGKGGPALMCHPIPARSSSDLEFNLPSRAAVQLGAYDVSGRLVRSFVSTVLEKGRYRYRWDLTAANGSRVAAGVYFIRLDATPGARHTRLLVVQ